MKTSHIIGLVVVGAAIAAYFLFLKPKAKPATALQAAQAPPKAKAPTLAIKKPLPPVKSTSGSQIVNKGITLAKAGCKAAGGGAACDVGAKLAAPVASATFKVGKTVAKSSVKVIKKLNPFSW